MFRELGRNWEKLSWPIVEVFGFVLIGLNFFFSYILSELSISYQINNRPFGFDINPLFTFLIFGFIIVALYKSQALDNYRLASSLIIAGAFSNFLEKVYFGGVKDYLDIFIANINLADIEIWTGLILLNFQVWASESVVTEDGETKRYYKWLRDKAEKIKTEN